MHPDTQGKFLMTYKEIIVPQNNSGRLKHSTVNIRQINETENQQGYLGLKCRTGTSGPNRHLQNSPPQIHRIYILLSTTSHLL